MLDEKLGDVRFHIDHDMRILYAERHDNITIEGVYAEWRAMQQLDGFDPSYETVVDYSRVPVVDLDASDIMKIQKDIPKYDVRTGNVAIVSGLTHGRFLLAKFFCRLANLIQDRKHQVFNSKVEAEVWLLSLDKDKTITS